MKLNRTQIIAGLTGIVLAGAGSFGMYKGIRADILSDPYRNTDIKKYDEYQKKRGIYGTLGVLSLICGTSTLVCFLEEDDNEKKYHGETK